ncbi:MAG: hypothetical protein DMD88_19685 [Candidatus Rokuibacteriota bacterium]|nr:MAG: hypothetical protein DMD88_19685 [Candidatus Rokubacteria bacterium]
MIGALLLGLGRATRPSATFVAGRVLGRRTLRPRVVCFSDRWGGDRFGFDQEITAEAAKLGCRVYEVRTSYYGRTYAEGKKVTGKEGVRGLWCIFRYAWFA